MHTRIAVVLGAAAIAGGLGVAAQRSGAFGASRDHPAIAYSDGPVTTAVTELNRRIEQGAVRLAFDPVSGYLRSALEALQIPVESQVLVYSQTSFQARLISRTNPRAIFFNDQVAVGWVRGGDILEVSAQDPRQGTVYYTIPQTPVDVPQFTRSDGCLSCHLSWETRAVPGPFVLTVFPRRSENEYADGGHSDHRAPLVERWGGWYVTGERVPSPHMGNIELLQPEMPASGPAPAPAKASLEGAFDLGGYLTPFSDVVALMVLEHQAHATNLITRAGWEYRQAEHDSARRGDDLSPRVREAVDELVDYFLFVDEAPLPTVVEGSSGFARIFSALGPRDPQGRSLRELQLSTRLMRYPCSFMIYSPGFDGLPEPVKRAVYERLRDVLSVPEPARRYSHLTLADRMAIVEILRATKLDAAAVLRPLPPTSVRPRA
jgi:hypothetical protein